MTEVEEAVLWLIQSNPDIVRIADAPHWRGVLFALVHPRRFGSASALALAAGKILKGEHRIRMPA